MSDTAEADALASWLAKSLIERVLGAAAAKYITNPLLSALNLSDRSQQIFQNEVLAQLAGIRAQLKEVQNSLAKIDTAVDKLRQTVERYAISADFTNYYTNAQFIERRYEYFVNNLAALTNPKADHRRAADEIHEMLSGSEVRYLADAMDAIIAFVVPRRGVLGLFDHILTAMRDAMKESAERESKYKIIPGSPYIFPSEDGVFSARKMLTNTFDAANELLVGFAVPVLQHVLATEAKGLILLSRAWAGGAHERTLNDFVDRVLDTVSVMKDFFPKRAVPTARKVTPAFLKQPVLHLKSVGLRRVRWSHLPIRDPRRNRYIVRNRFPDRAAALPAGEWVMWALFPNVWRERIGGDPLPDNARLMMVRKPWEGGTRPAILLEWTPPQFGVEGHLFMTRINQQWQFLPPVPPDNPDYLRWHGGYTILSPAEFLKHKDVTDFLSKHIGELALDADKQIGVKVDVFEDKPPAKWTELLNGLPVKREQLTT